jgi:anti-sigma-K factor RskA
MPWAIGVAAAAVIAGLFSAGMVASRYEARIGFMARETARVRAELQRQDAALRDRLASAQGVIDLLRDPASHVVALRGAAGMGRLVWHEERGGYLVVANIPPAPAGKVYELWTISAGQPRPAGLFTVDASGEATHPVAATRAPVQVFAVTVEPAGGTPAPTGPMILASK